MIIRVKYHNNTYDMIKDRLLDEMIRENKISMFYRSQHWVILGKDPIRGMGRGLYHGPERRQAAVPSE